MSDAAPGSFDPKAFVRQLASGPGVYRMLAADDGVLYVGKAKNLRKRVGSYFLRESSDRRIQAMLAQVASIEVVVTRTEGEALVLENELIKSLKPRYNILLRDDKSYPYIFLSADEYPRLGFHRGSKSAKGRYFGPFPNAQAVRESLTLMQKLFRVRQCENSYFAHRTRPCLQYQIRRCSGPCVGLVSQERYAEDLRHASMFLEGRSTQVIDELATAMDLAAQSLDFERAAVLRDQIAQLRQVQARQYVAGGDGELDVIGCHVEGGMACVQILYFRNGMNFGNRAFFPKVRGEVEPAEVLAAFLPQYYLDKAPPNEILLSHPIEDEALLEQVLGERGGRRCKVASRTRGDRARFVEMAQANAENALRLKLGSQSTLRQRFDALADLLGIDESIGRIECFDISHTQGEATVASCVVWGVEGAIRSDYRRFNISGITPGDDYAAMRQALQRRYARLAEGEGVLPDLLLIDGGQGQMRQALEVLDDLGVQGVLVVGVAKGEERRAGHETLIVGADQRMLWPGPDSPASHLVQAVRDEAHRFAITGHRARRQKARERSRLEDVEGIGPGRRAALLKHFGGLQGVSQAGVEELMQVRGINRELAERIYRTLNEPN